jgi:formiminotetrahydrofolate cyclodeaminase
MADLLETRLKDVLDELGSEEPIPGAGAAAAVTAALAAAIVGMAARAQPGWEGSAGAAAQANGLRRRIAPLADIDAAAYAESLAALRLPKQGLEEEVRNMAIRDTLALAAAVPLAIAEAAADVSLLAVEVAERCDPAIRVDVVAAAHLAAGAARGAAELVAVNLGVHQEDDRLTLARGLADTAAASARRLGTFGSSPP